MILLNPCFIKQTRNGYFIYSKTNDRMFSVIHGFSKYSESKCLRMNYVSDYESYSLTAKNFAVVNSISYFRIMRYIKTTHEAYVDEANND